MNDKWISVKKKKPKNLQRVLVCVRDGNFDYFAMVYYANNVFSECLSECSRFNYLTLSNLVTHWMPLPESPYAKKD